MNVTHWMDTAVCDRLLMTLAHFLWQGMLVGAIVLLGQIVLSRATARWRHSVALLALGVMAVCPVVTFLLVPGADSERASSSDGVAQAPTAATSTRVEAVEKLSSGPAAAVSAPVVDQRPALPARHAVEPPVELTESRIFDHLALNRVPESWRRGAIAAYLVGLLLMTGRLLFSLWSARRLRSSAVPVTENAILHALRTEVKRLGLRRVPAVAWCRRIAVPTVTGLIRPIVLLPVSLCTSLSADQLAAILLHELAHLRRWDPWIQLVQRFAESLLFFHPAVWYVSRQLTVERELCCDELVVSLGAEPVQYADALLRVAEAATSANDRRHALALQAAGRDGHLGQRIRRLLRPQARESLRPGRGTWAVAALLLVVLASPFWLAWADGPEATDTRQLSAPLSDERPDEQPAGRYSVTLQNGVAVEVVAVARNPRHRRQWWAPDGTPIPTPVDELEFLAPTPEGVDTEDEVALIVRTAVPKQNGRWVVQPEFIPAPRADRGWANGYREFEPAGQAQILVYPSDVERITYRFAIAAGPWEQVATFDGKTVQIHVPEAEVACTVPRQEGSAVRFDVTHNVDRDRYGLRMRARLKDGSIRDVAFHPGVVRGVPAKGFVDAYAITADQVAEYIVERTPWTRGEIPGIALNPKDKLPPLTNDDERPGELTASLKTTIKNGILEAEGWIPNSRAVDLETGKLHEVNHGDEQNGAEAMTALRQWAAKSRADLVYSQDDPQPLLIGLEAVLIRADSGRWFDGLERRRLAGNTLLQHAVPGFPTVVSAPEAIPAAFMVRTREGGLGVLQIAEFSADQESMRIRYRLRVAAGQPGLEEGAATEDGRRIGTVSLANPDARIELSQDSVASMLGVGNGQRAAKGLQVRLHADRQHWQADEDVVLQLDLALPENGGTLEQMDSPDNWLLDVDGETWLIQHVSYESSRPFRIEPGQTRSNHAILRFHRGDNGIELQRLTSEGKVWSELAAMRIHPETGRLDSGRRLDLRPGDHVVRIRFQSQKLVSDVIVEDRIWSNALTLTIRDDDQPPARTRQPAVPQKEADAAAKRHHFVRLVVGPDRLTFEGRDTTWDALSDTLRMIAERSSTVLEVAIATDEISVAKEQEIVARAAAEAKKAGLDHASYIGVHDLGSQGSESKSIREGTEAVAPAAPSKKPKHFVRVVVGADSLRFVPREDDRQPGQKTTWEKLPQLLEKVPNRAETVLEVALESEEFSVRELNSIQGKAAALARMIGFQHSSYVGVQSNQEAGSPANEPPSHGASDPEPLRPQNDRGESSERNEQRDGPATEYGVLWSASELSVPTDKRNEWFLSLEDGRLHASVPDDQPAVIVGRPKRSGGRPNFHIRFRDIHTVPLEREQGTTIWETRTAEEHAKLAAGFFGEVPFERHFDYSVRPDELPLTISLTNYGLLQVTEIVGGESPSLKIRYKLLQQTGHRAPEQQRPANTASDSVDDQEALQGTWKFIAAADGGRKGSQEHVNDSAWVITGEKIAFMQRGKTKAEWTYRLDPTRQPKWIDLVVDRRTVMRGIYELSENRLKVCFNDNKGEERSTAFESKPDSPNDVLLVLKRVPPDNEKASAQRSVPQEKSVEQPVSPPWGDPVDGVSVRLTRDKSGSLRAEVRNQGRSNWLVFCDGEFGELELDGTRYFWGGNRQGRCLRLSPGQHFDAFPVDLDYPGFWSRWGTANGEPRQLEALRLSPGEHTVRFAPHLYPEDGRRESHRIWSQPVTIRIADGDRPNVGEEFKQ